MNSLVNVRNPGTTIDLPEVVVEVQATVKVVEVEVEEEVVVTGVNRLLLVGVVVSPFRFCR
jgi:hypothetical protein